jgi:hypothetical protein
MSEEKIGNGVREKIILVMISVIITWITSLFTVHSTVSLHSYKINSVEQNIQEIRLDIKAILKELRK